MRVFLAAVITASISISPHVARAEAMAQPKGSPAKGTKECLIVQYTSDHLEKRHDEAIKAAGVHFYMQTRSSLKFRVTSTGAVTASVAEDTYPGSKFYLLVGGKRYAGESRYQLPLDGHAVKALRDEQLINFTYTDWPYRAEINREDIFTGFAKAYDECRAYFGPAPVAAKPQ